MKYNVLLLCVAFLSVGVVKADTCEYKDAQGVTEFIEVEITDSTVEYHTEVLPYFFEFEGVRFYGTYTQDALGAFKESRSGFIYNSIFAEAIYCPPQSLSSTL